MRNALTCVQLRVHRSISRPVTTTRDIYHGIKTKEIRVIRTEYDTVDIVGYNVVYTAE